MAATVLTNVELLDRAEHPALFAVLVAEDNG